MTILRCLAASFLFCLNPFALRAEAPRPGFVIHFDFIRSAEEGVALVEVAQRAGATVIDVVPPAHVWTDPRSQVALDAILKEIQARGLGLLFTRIDAAFLPRPEGGEREYYLYDHLLTERGRMPNGQKTVDFFLSTVGVPGYAEWMEEETRFYAERYGKLPNLMGINLGPFSEPFSAERCGFLEYLKATDRYELTQYTRFAARVWDSWLAKHFGTIQAVNREYGIRAQSFGAVPMPKSERDRRFKRGDLAYFDLVRAMGDWYLERYTRCRDLWHAVSGRADVPFILQFSGFVAEKFECGRGAHLAFDLPAWIARADAVGLSVYTNSGYPDQGRASLRATVQLLALAMDLGKEAFVVEGGVEAPNVVLDPELLGFFATVALPLAPKTYVYEYLKDKFNEAYAENPGKLVRSDGTLREPAFRSLKALFQGIEAAPPTALETPRPRLCLEVDLDQARMHPETGKLNAALFELAGQMPVRWIPKGTDPTNYAGTPIVHSDGRVTGGSPALAALLAEIPETTTREREAWVRGMKALLGGLNPERR